MALVLSIVVMLISIYHYYGVSCFEITFLLIIMHGGGTCGRGCMALVKRPPTMSAP